MFPRPVSMYERISPPAVGERITFKDGEPIVPDMPII
ncbi:Isocitrate dehydrogenase, partial [Haemophilus parainfluenzae]